MEVTTSSQTSLYKIISSTKIPTNSDNLEFETLLPTEESSSNKANTTSSNSNTKASAYVDLSTSTQQISNLYNAALNKGTSTANGLFFTSQSQLPWEQQLAFPGLQLGIWGEDQDLNWESCKDVEPMEYQWIVNLRSATNGNKYDNAPEFKAFVDKWISKGLSEDEALERAGIYAAAGLLDYGSQKATSLHLEKLPSPDIKQHGLWLIENPPLKDAMLNLFDSLSDLDVSNLYDAIFHGGVEYQNETGIDFETLLQKYGVKLEDLKQTDPQFAKDNPEVFSGDINLKNDNSKESQEYNNFIFKTLIGFFKDRIESIDQYDKDHPDDNPPGYFESRKDNINLLIDTFQKEVDTYHVNIQGSKGK